MSLEEWADLHGEDYSKRKFFSALDWGRGDRTCMTIYCDYCEQPFEIKEDELDDWMVVDPVVALPRNRNPELDHVQQPSDPASGVVNLRGLQFRKHGASIIYREPLCSD